LLPAQEPRCEHEAFMLPLGYCHRYICDIDALHVRRICGRLPMMPRHFFIFAMLAAMLRQH